MVLGWGRGSWKMLRDAHVRGELELGSVLGLGRWSFFVGVMLLRLSNHLFHRQASASQPFGDQVKFTCLVAGLAAFMEERRQRRSGDGC